MRLRAFACTITPEVVMADCRKPECRAELRVTLYRLFEQVECCLHTPVAPGQAARHSPQIQIVSGKVGRRPRHRAPDLRRLHRRFDNTCDAGCDAILQIEYLFHRTVEAVGQR